MDLSKLSQNEKLALYGAGALIVGGVVGYAYGLTMLGLLAAIAMLVLIFLPQFSPNTALPGSRGSLMVAVGGVAGAAMALAFLSALAGALLVRFDLRDVFFLIAVVGGLLMAWAGWQEFQAEGGKLQFGTSSSATPAATGNPEAKGDPAPPAQPVSTEADPTPATHAATTEREDAPPDERPTA